MCVLGDTKSTFPWFSNAFRFTCLSKYSSNIEGNEVVEMLDNRRFNQTPNLEFILDGDY